MKSFTLLVYITQLIGCSSSVNEERSIGDLFTDNEGIVLEVKIDVEGCDVTAQEARAYCKDQLTAMGLSVLEEISKEDAWQNRLPFLSIQTEAGFQEEGPDSWRVGDMTEESHPYYFCHTTKYWDVVVIKRSPKKEGYWPIFDGGGGCGYSTEDEYRKLVSWDGIQHYLDHSLDLFQKSLIGEWTPPFQIKEKWAE